MRSVSFLVRGMKCERCTRTLESVLSAAPGVQQVVASLATGRVELAFDAGATNEAVLASVIERAGFDVPGGCP